MDYLDNLSLSELFDFLEYRNSYKDMIDSADNLIEQAESKYEYEKEQRQIDYLERNGKNEHISKN